MKKMLFAFAFAIVAVGLAYTVAFGGGWAVVTLDHWPNQVIAGQPVTIGFIVRQHGVTPTNGFDPVIIARSTETNAGLRVVPQQSGPVGHFTADVVFPNAGLWKWSIQTLSLDQPMPPLTVLASAPAPTRPATTVESTLSLLPSVGLAVLGWLIALAIFFFGRRLPATAVRSLLFISIVAGLVGFVWMGIQISTPAAQATAAASSAKNEPAMQGKALFLAKGCIVCHQNSTVADWQGSFVSGQFGPNLTNLKLTSEFLHRWLKDPSAVKPGTAMPTLGLSDEEIDLLTAFLTQTAAQ